MDKKKKIEAKDLGITKEEYERVLKERRADFVKSLFVSTNTPIPPEEKKKILTTRDLPTPEELEQKKKTDEILAAREEKK